MKITIRNLMEASKSGALDALSNLGGPIKVKTVRKLKRLRMLLQPELAAADAAHMRLFNDENSIAVSPGVRQIKPECMAQYIEDSQSFFAEEIEIAAEPIEANDLDEATGITEVQLRALGALLKD